MNSLLNDCTLCPRKCHVNRYKKTGFCQANDKIKIARYSLHQWEEPCISGKYGSGTIFFSTCNLKCVYCQNYQISTLNNGKEISTKRLAEICLELQKQKAHNINLVTPTMYVPLIVEAIKIAKTNGLTIPIVYNTSSYETKETLKLLDGIVDIYLADFKYFDDTLGIKYSKAPTYKKYATEAIKEMYKQTGNPKFKNNIMTKGVIVRHLLLPKHVDDSKKIINYLFNTYQNNIYYSLMNQYTPIQQLEFEELNHIVSCEEYDEFINYAYDLGIRKAFIQEGETQKESFIPDFSNYQEI